MDVAPEKKSEKDDKGKTVKDEKGKSESRKRDRQEEEDDDPDAGGSEACANCSAKGRKLRQTPCKCGWVCWRCSMHHFTDKKKCRLCRKPINKSTMPDTVDPVEDSPSTEDSPPSVQSVGVRGEDPERSSEESAKDYGSTPSASAAEDDSNGKRKSSSASDD